ncbi:MAG: cytochrome b N-terminal domain-containing protein [Holophaga sp.]|nr:cytochrome b N-terminal domain-containing protein [Holophaga sp.]
MRCPRLRSNTWFGDLLRNLHHWSANLLIITSLLHLLRVFFTGGHRGGRELNWLLGLGMQLLVLGANFTGYLLPGISSPFGPSPWAPASSRTSRWWANLSPVCCWAAWKSAQPLCSTSIPSTSVSSRSQS